ncbi:hypothetical protein [Micromonospora sp. KC721]|uniref:hypothetical protein n=1 Tax=Micromonospora sp. KC721 TaxID=2530380 RepID=UPI001043FA35|nr:hypothetical protein [Micromonospora sp. KC721]TDB79765.1 hypothetical protein E1182_11430 [Micromonospora sp. KC721]
MSIVPPPAAIPVRAVGRPDTEPERGRPVLWIVRHYPVTVVVLAPYALLIVPLAVLHANPDTGFVLRLLGAALLGTVAVETAALALRRRRWRPGVGAVNASYRHVYLAARIVAVVGVLASITGAQAGHGTIFTQLTADVAASPVTRVTSLAAGWSYLAFALLLASYLGGHAPRRRVLCWVGFLVAGQIVTVTATGITSPAFGYLSFLAAAGAVCGLLRAREVVVVGVVLLVAWPTLFTLRNELRVEGGVSVAADVTASDRLRLDLQLAEVAQHDAPVDVGQPGITDFARYGLVPRMLDPDRPPLSTGALINQYLGGSATSAYSFLALGNVYFIEGWSGVPLYYAGWAAVAVLLLRARGTPGPVRLTLFCFVLAGPLLWSSSHPDSMIGFLQHTVSALPVLLLLRRTRVKGRHAVGPQVRRQPVAAVRTGW